MPAESGESASSSTPSVAPSPSVASGKIQKSSKKQIKVAPENLAKALDSIPEFNRQQNGHATAQQTPPLLLQGLGLGKLEDDPAGSAEVQDTSNSLQSHQGEEVKPKGSCCSQESQQPPPPPVQTQPPASCCKKVEPPPSNGRGENPGSTAVYNPYDTNINQIPYSSVSTPQISHYQPFQVPSQGHFVQPFLGSPSHGAVPHYMPNYIPQTPSESSTNFSSHHHAASNLGFAPAIMPQSLSNFTYQPVVEDDSSHDCRCGDNCQCLGCASHPFNTTTRQHVQQMGLLVALDGDDRTMNGYQNGSMTAGHHNVNGMPFDYSYTAYGQNISNASQPLSMPTYGEPTASPTNGHNGYSSPPTNFTTGPPMMEPSEYYTLEYPVGLPAGCSDITGSCQCGNDCSCVGCLTHSGHNGISLEPMPESHSTTPAIQPMTSSASTPHPGSTPVHLSPSATVPSSASML